jgi:hypothetical protein
MAIQADNKSITQKEFDNMTAGFELDMTSIFKIMMDNVEGLLRQAEREGWDEDKLIDEVTEAV